MRIVIQCSYTLLRETLAHLLPQHGLFPAFFFIAFEGAHES